MRGAWGWHTLQPALQHSGSPRVTVRTGTPAARQLDGGADLQAQQRGQQRQQRGRQRRAAHTVRMTQGLQAPGQAHQASWTWEGFVMTPSASLKRHTRHFWLTPSSSQTASRHKAGCSVSAAVHTRILQHHAAQTEQTQAGMHAAAQSSICTILHRRVHIRSRSNTP